MSRCFNWKGYGLLNPLRFYLVFLHYGHHPTLEKGRDIGGTSFLMSYAVRLFRVCSILVLRQTLLAECLVTSPSEMEDLVSKSATKLFELLDNEEDAGITEVVETMNFCLEGDDPEKHQARKEIMVNVLAKSLRAGDAVFTRVSRTVFLAARAILLCGTGAEGRLLAENTLKRIGATLLSKADGGYGRSVGCSNCLSHCPWFVVSRIAKRYESSVTYFCTWK